MYFSDNSIISLILEINGIIYAKLHTPINECVRKKKTIKSRWQMRLKSETGVSIQAGRHDSHKTDLKTATFNVSTEKEV